MIFSGNAMRLGKLLHAERCACKTEVQGHPKKRSSLSNLFLQLLVFGEEKK